MTKRIRIALAAILVASALGFGVSSSSSLVAGAKPPRGVVAGSGGVKPGPA